jgi:hypothetical protein
MALSHSPQGTKRKLFALGCEILASKYKVDSLCYCNVLIFIPTMAMNK